MVLDRPVASACRVRECELLITHLTRHEHQAMLDDVGLSLANVTLITTFAAQGTATRADRPRRENGVGVTGLLCPHTYSAGRRSTQSIYSGSDQMGDDQALSWIQISAPSAPEFQRGVGSSSTRAYQSACSPGR